MTRSSVSGQTDGCTWKVLRIIFKKFKIHSQCGRSNLKVLCWCYCKYMWIADPTLHQRSSDWSDRLRWFIFRVSEEPMTFRWWKIIHPNILFSWKYIKTKWPTNRTPYFVHSSYLQDFLSGHLSDCICVMWHVDPGTVALRSEVQGHPDRCRAPTDFSLGYVSEMSCWHRSIAEAINLLLALWSNMLCSRSRSDGFIMMAENRTSKCDQSRF